jgi:hypothetical protein
MNESHETNVRLMVTNEAEREIDLIFEPLGEIYPLAPGQSRLVVYSGGAEPKLSVDYDDTEIKIWAESAGDLELADPDAPGAFV